MDIKLLNTDENHEKALNHIAMLMDAKANTPEGEELDRLVALVETYEDEHLSFDN